MDRCRPTRATRISHVFGPHDRFRPTATPLYALPDATPQVAATLRKTLGLTRGVLVQPAPYGSNPDAMLSAIAAAPGHAPTGIAVADPGIDTGTLERWRRAGIVAGSASSRCARTGWQPLSRQRRLRCHCGAGAAHAGCWPSRPAMGQGG